MNKFFLRKRLCLLGLPVVLLAAVVIGSLLLKKEEVEPKVAAAGSSFNTFIKSGGEKIAVHVALPAAARYSDGAPVAVYTPTFFTPEVMDFSNYEGFTKIGAIEISLLYPGQTEKGGAASSGTNDYGGEKSIAALRDVIKFASGDFKNVDGFTLDELSVIPPLFNNVGLYAFSHPGLAATNVLSEYGDELSVAWFVGRENPTIDTIFPLEIGYFAEDNKTPLLNPLYVYPDSYSSEDITLDYSSIRYDSADDRPYFDLNGDNRLDSGDYELGDKVPTMFGKRFYSTELLSALRENGLSAAAWPADLATPEAARELWPPREAVGKYKNLKGSDLRLMLVFCEKDHVLAAPDKPHIHQAYDGFSAAGLWVRLNPDAAYVGSLNPKALGRAVEHEANTEPDDWSKAAAWGYPDKGANHILMPSTAVAEMADRTKDNNWSADLDRVLYEYDATNAVKPAAETPSWSRGRGENEFWVTNPTTKARLYVKIYYPSDFRNGNKIKAVVLVPGSNNGSSEFANQRKKPDDLTAAGLAAVVFDPDGRGQSGGAEDQNGHNQQDGLAAIIKFLVNDLPDAQINDVGIATFSFGLSMGSGVAARYPDLPIRFLMDWEGPIDRNDFAGCDADHTGHLAGLVECDDDDYFAEREGLTFVQQLKIPYQRIQSEIDHAGGQQGDKSAILIVNAAVAAGLPWVRLNDYDPGETYALDNPPTMLPEAMDKILMSKVAEYAVKLFN
jgi:alpha/beta superfamily hydrolase